MRIVVIGGIAGGTSAAAKAKRVNKGAEIVIYERGEYVSVGACGMPYVLSGLIKDPFKLVVRRPEDFERSGIQVRLGCEVRAIYPERGEVEVSCGSEVFKDRFDRLIIATGASARRLSVPGEELKGVFTLKGLGDLLAVEEFIASESPRRVLVVGGGFIGLELVSALCSRGMEVLHLYRGGHVPSRFDPDVVGPVVDAFREKGVGRLWECQVEAFEGRDRVERVRLSSGDVVDVDMVLVAVGVSPNSELARDAGLELGVSGAIAVNERMETSAEGIFAAGDCTHCYSAVTKKPIYLPLGSIANRHGRVAGTNAAGGNAVVKPVAASTVFRFFDLGVAKTGLTEREARAEGFEASSVLVKAGDKAHYYPGSSKIWVKLVWDKPSGRILGAQMIGHYTAVKRIDVVGALICKGATVEDLKHVDMAYSPPFSPAWDPLSVAANQAVKD